MEAAVSPGARTPLEHALKQAEDDVLERLSGIRGLLAEAMASCVERDTDRADRLLGHARELARFHAHVHEELMALIARQAPVAGDLRLVMALLQANDRIARMEAQCMDIANLGKAISESEPPSRSQLDCLVEMGKLVDAQLAEAAEALREREIDRVRHVRKRDLEVNAHNRTCFDLAVHEGSDEARRSAAFHGALMARALERIGDNAVEIARLVTFVVTAQFRAPA
jgi:phosphate transport system protein